MVAIFIGFSRKRGGSPRRQRPGNITLRVYAGVRSVESSAVSSDITVDEARRVVARWVHAQVAAEPGFRGAFLTGSATDLPGAATLPRSSDVDVTVLVAAAAERRSGKQVVDGVLADVSYLEERVLADPAWVAASFVYAPSFRGGQVLADPTGHLGRLEAAIAPGFATPAAVRARTADVHRRIRARLTALDPEAAWPDLVIQWLFPTSLTAVAKLVAALRMPTVRLRYLRARAVTPPAEYERLLALVGCADLAPGLAARHLDAVAARFDEAAAVLARSSANHPDDRARGDRGAAAAGGPLPFAADLTPAGRPVAIDGSRDLVAGGNHREAVFWIVATAARCQAVLNAHDPALAAERDQAFRALVADLTGLRTPADVLTRRDALLADLAAPPPAGRSLRTPGAA
jgi:hypothetical protein